VASEDAEETGLARSRSSALPTDGRTTSPPAARPNETLSPPSRVRMQLHWHRDAGISLDAASADQVVDPKVMENIDRLKDYGLTFDLQLFPGQMRDGARLVDEHPETNFILTHWPECWSISRPRTPRPGQAGLRQFAGKPNFFAKLSGLGTFGTRTILRFIGYVVE